MVTTCGAVSPCAVLGQNPVLDVVCLALTIYTIALLVRIIASWFPISPASPAAGFFSLLHGITEPVLAPARRIIPPIGGTIDISPFLVFLLLAVVRSVIGCRGGLF